MEALSVGQRKNAEPQSIHSEESEQFRLAGRISRDSPPLSLPSTSVIRTPCILCGTEWNSKEELWDHIAGHHLQYNPVGCGYCHFWFTSERLLRSHLREQDRHPGFVDKLCRKQAALEESLNRLMIMSEEALRTSMARLEGKSGSTVEIDLVQEEEKPDITLLAETTNSEKRKAFPSSYFQNVEAAPESSSVSIGDVLQGEDAPIPDQEPVYQYEPSTRISAGADSEGNMILEEHPSLLQSESKEEIPDFHDDGNGIEPVSTFDVRAKIHSNPPTGKARKTIRKKVLPPKRASSPPRGSQPKRTSLMSRHEQKWQLLINSKHKHSKMKSPERGKTLSPHKAPTRLLDNARAGSEPRKLPGTEIQCSEEDPGIVTGKKSTRPASEPRENEEEEVGKVGEERVGMGTRRGGRQKSLGGDSRRQRSSGRPRQPLTSLDSEPPPKKTKGRDSSRATSPLSAESSQGAEEAGTETRTPSTQQKEKKPRRRTKRGRGVTPGHRKARVCERSALCALCDNVIWKHSMLRHVAEVHFHKDLVECPYCPETRPFTVRFDEEDMRKHIRLSHRGNPIPDLPFKEEYLSEISAVTVRCFGSDIQAIWPASQKEKEAKSSKKKGPLKSRQTRRESETPRPSSASSVTSLSLGRQKRRRSPVSGAVVPEKAEITTPCRVCGAKVGTGDLMFHVAQSHFHGDLLECAYCKFSVRFHIQEMYRHWELKHRKYRWKTNDHRLSSKDDLEKLFRKCFPRLPVPYAGIWIKDAKELTEESEMGTEKRKRSVSARMKEYLEETSSTDGDSNRSTDPEGKPTLRHSGREKKGKRGRSQSLSNEDEPVSASSRPRRLLSKPQHKTKKDETPRTGRNAPKNAKSAKKTRKEASSNAKNKPAQDFDFEFQDEELERPGTFKPVKKSSPLSEENSLSTSWPQLEKADDKAKKGKAQKRKSTPKSGKGAKAPLEEEDVPQDTDKGELSTKPRLKGRVSTQAPIATFKGGSPSASPTSLPVKRGNADSRKSFPAKKPSPAKVSVVPSVPVKRKKKETFGMTTKNMFECIRKARLATDEGRRGKVEDTEEPSIQSSFTPQVRPKETGSRIKVSTAKRSCPAATAQLQSVAQKFHSLTPQPHLFTARHPRVSPSVQTKKVAVPKTRIIDSQRHDRRTHVPRPRRVARISRDQPQYPEAEAESLDENVDDVEWEEEEEGDRNEGLKTLGFHVGFGMVCRLCGLKDDSSRISLEDHLFNHISERYQLKRFKCGGCAFQCVLMTSLSNHILSLHQPASDSDFQGLIVDRGPEMQEYFQEMADNCYPGMVPNSHGHHGKMCGVCKKEISVHRLSDHVCVHMYSVQRPRYECTQCGEQAACREVMEKMCWKKHGSIEWIVDNLNEPEFQNLFLEWQDVCFPQELPGEPVQEEVINQVEGDGETLQAWITTAHHNHGIFQSDNGIQEFNDTMEDEVEREVAGLVSDMVNEVAAWEEERQEVLEIDPKLANELLQSLIADPDVHQGDLEELLNGISSF